MPYLQSGDVSPPTPPWCIVYSLIVYSLVVKAFPERWGFACLQDRRILHFGFLIATVYCVKKGGGEEIPMDSFRKAGTPTEVLRAPPEQLSGDCGRGTGENTLQPLRPFRMPWWCLLL